MSESDHTLGSAHRVFPPLRLRFAVWWALFAGCGLAASVFGEALWDDAVIISFIVAGIALIASVHLRSRSDEVRSRPIFLMISLMNGIILGAILLLDSMLSWFLAAVVMRGRSSEAVMWAPRLVLAMFLGSIVLVLARKPWRPRWNYVRLAVNWLLAACAFVALISFILYTGPDNLSVYPRAAASPYRLPCQPGIRRLCCQ